MNLAVNAKDAMPSGGKLIIETARWVTDQQFASAHLGLPPGTYVMMSVSDTGVGMTAEVKAHLFEPFFTTKDQGRGTGLGLSTVYGIVKQCGGAVWAHSEAGKGTTFRMLFPALEAAAAKVEVVEGAARPFGNETILLSEDEPGVRKYVRQILAVHGYTVLEAANGRDAIQLAQDHPGTIHLLLTDVVMPDLGGSDLFAEIRPLRRSMSVLYMSGYTDRVWREPEMAASFIQKPFSAATLLTQIRTILDAARSRNPEQP
jgi:CheY-like chemotaxis protein